MHEFSVGEALRSFDRVAAVWGLSKIEKGELLGIRVVGPALDVRLSALMKIFGSLHVLYSDTVRSAIWLRSSNADLDGKCPLDVMKENCTGLLLVRNHLFFQMREVA